ncbi:GNAT family N-acetyltransferase [Geopseudomonas aromaticivorans]
MPVMTDPMNALIDLQKAVRKGFATQPGEINPALRVVFDKPEGHARITYARIEQGRVKALAIFLMVEPIDGIACLQVGYAVPEFYHGRGWATEIVEQGIQELRKGMGRNGGKQFYVEAIVGKDNLASQRVAAKIFPDAPRETTDSVSGEPALAYTRLVDC